MDLVYFSTFLFSKVKSKVGFAFWISFEKTTVSKMGKWLWNFIKSDDPFYFLTGQIKSHW